MISDWMLHLEFAAAIYLLAITGFGSRKTTLDTLLFNVIPSVLGAVLMFVALSRLEEAVR